MVQSVSKTIKKILLAIAIAIPAAVGVILWTRFEWFAPRFEGKTVHQCIQAFSGEQFVPEQMIRAFGLTAIPELSASCRRSLILYWTARYLPKQWRIRREQEWMENTSYAYMWIYRLGEENGAAVAISLANQRDVLNLPQFLFKQCDTNQLANFSSQKTNLFLHREASRVLALKLSHQPLSRTALDLATFP